MQGVVSNEFPHLAPLRIASPRINFVRVPPHPLWWDLTTDGPRIRQQTWMFMSLLGLQPHT